MVFDDTRNSIYATAIARHITPESVVIDLGAGSGIHGLMAARAGARCVYLIEPSTEIDTARRLAEQHGWSDRVVCVQDTIEQADIKEQADVIVSVFTGNFLLEEDLLPSLFYARDHYLSANGTMLPDRAVMEVVPVSAPGYFDDYIGCWSRPAQGLDFSLVRQFAANTLYYDDHSGLAEEQLATPVELLDMDFMQASSASCHNRVDITITGDGECHGMMGWFRARIGDEWLSTAPTAPSTHWRQVLMPLDPPINLVKGAVVEFELQRPEFGEWTWTVSSGEITQRHSTFLSEPISTRRVQQKSDHYQGELSKRGEVALLVLQRLDGAQTNLAIAHDIAQQFPALFPDVRQAKQFVASLVERFSQ